MIQVDSRPSPYPGRVANVETWLTAAVVAAVFMLLVPLPTALVDLLLALQLAAALAILLTALGHAGPWRGHGRSHRAAVFPVLILCATFFRLALNVSTTRLILGRGDAGAVIDSFAGIAVAESLLVGVVLFAMIALVQFVVVARGSERVAEVAARFSLDAMPGEQLAIDADVRAGRCDARAAARRRERLRRESRFIGSMDGAMRFVRGDAVVALAMVFVNLVGGLIVGVGSYGMSPSDAAATFLMLSIGDGLAVQIPALLIALAAGMIVTRPPADASADLDLELELGAGGEAAGPGRARHASAIATAPALVAGVFLALSLAPGVPFVPFASVALGAALLALWTWRGHAAHRAAAAAQAASRRQPLELVLGVDIARELGASPSRDEPVRALLRPIRARLARRVGVGVPEFSLRIDTDAPEACELSIEGVVVARPEVLAGAALSLFTERIPSALERYAFELIDVQAVSDALDALSRERPALLREVVPRLIDRVRLTTLVRRLVRERIPVPSLAEILRALAEVAPDGVRDMDVALATERVRRGLRRIIGARYAPRGHIPAWRLDPLIEDTLRGALERDEHGAYLAIEPEIAHEIASAIARATSIGDDDPRARSQIVLASADVRRFVAQLIEVEAPDAVVLSPGELDPATRVETLAVIGP